MKIIIPILALCAILCGCKQESKVSFTRNNDIIQNPGQGWMFHTAKMNKNLPYGVVYRRYQWKNLEPKEGEYNFEVIESDIRNAVKEGLPFSFRIMCVSAHSSTPYASPEWVFKKDGVKSAKFINDTKYASSGGIPIERVTPIFDNDEFIKIHARFIKALAKKYDGDPRISSIDIGSYGNWGEWHCWGLGIKPASFKYKKQYADMYLDNFKKTPLVFMSDDAETLKYAIGAAEGSRVGMRRDGVGGDDHYNHWIGKGKFKEAGVDKMGDVWKYKPIQFEWYTHYNEMLQRKWPLSKAVDFIIANHASTLAENLKVEEVVAAEMPLVEKLSKSLGARIFIDSAKTCVDGNKLDISLECQNGGISQISIPYELLYELRSADGKVVQSWKSKADPTSWLPSKFVVSDSFALPKTIQKGKYELVVRLAHKGGIFRDFKIADKEVDSSGNLKIAEITL